MRRMKLIVRKSLLFRANATAIANTRNGIEYVTSVTRISASSKNPPRNPANTPIRLPTAAPERTTKEEYIRSMRIAFRTASPNSIPGYVVHIQPSAAVPPRHQNGAFEDRSQQL